jgi:hypothetical protein
MICLDKIFAKCDIVDGCLMWGGAVNTRDEIPLVHRPTRSLRRLVYEHFHWTDYPMPKELRVMMSCGNARCLTVTHMRAVEASTFLGNINRGVAKPALGVIRMTIARRARSAHSIEKARSVRADLNAGMTTREAARKHAISQALVSKIGRGQIWREFAADVSVFTMTGAQP